MAFVGAPRGRTQPIMSPTTTSQDAARIVRALEADFERNANARNAVPLPRASTPMAHSFSHPTRRGKGQGGDPRVLGRFPCGGSTDVELKSGDVSASGELSEVGWLELRVGDRLEVDVAMEIGDVLAGEPRHARRTAGAAVRRPRDV